MNIKKYFKKNTQTTKRLNESIDGYLCSEKSLVSNHCDDSDNFICFNCNKTHNSLEHGVCFKCSCGVIFQSYGNGLYIKKEGFKYNPTRKFSFEPIFTDRPPTGLESFFKDIWEKENKDLIHLCVSDHTTRLMIPSQAFKNLTVFDQTVFKCPYCEIEYRSPKHGKYWTCKCETLFFSAGNGLYNVDNKKLKIMRVCKSF